MPRRPASAISTNSFSREGHDLNALLGLEPEVKLWLSDRVRLPAIDARKLRPLLADLAARRPDLLALAAGYQAQEEKVRRAIIEQFPKLSVGSNFKPGHQRYNKQQSIAVTISLPLFDRNQGNIAVEQATREQLRQRIRLYLIAPIAKRKG